MAGPSKAHTFWMALHRYSGLVILLFLGWAALTGTALVFVRPLDEALNADLFEQTAPAGASAVDTLVDGFRAAHPEYSVQYFPLAVPADSRIPVLVSERQGITQVFLDRATGQIAGTRSHKPALTRRGFAEWLIESHYTLMLGDYGRWFMGVVALAWMISNVVGGYLTFPVRGAFWKQWKRIWRFSFKSPFPRQMLDLHRASGLWLFLPLMLLALTSVCLNFFSEGYAPVVEWAAPQEELPLPKVTPQGPLTFAKAVDQARKVAGGFGDGWQPATVLFDAKDGTIGVTLTDNGLLNYHKLGPVYLFFDAATGKLTEVKDPYRGDRNLVGYRLLYPVHSGRIAGWPTLALVFVTGLATFGLCVTGVWLWWKRRGLRKSAARRKA